MIIIVLIISLLLISFLFAKRIFTRISQAAYERSLLKEDKEKATKLGKIYYLSLDEDILKAKGIVDIDAKIAEDFRAFTQRIHFIAF